MVYIVEVRGRMLILAASRLSMIVLEKETEWRGGRMGKGWGKHGKREKKN